MIRRLGFFMMVLIIGFTMACTKATEKGKNAASRFGPVASDLGARLSKWKRVEMPFDASGLSPREQQEVHKLVEASQYLDDAFWRQSDPEALELYRSLEGNPSGRDRDLRRLLMINGSRFDLLDDNRPFVGTQAMPPGRALYPVHLTRSEIESYVKNHPSSKSEIYSPYTIIRRQGDELLPIPYDVAYQQFLQPAAKALREAAGLSDDPAFAQFLEMRARALLNDNYYPSDVKWLELKNPKIDVIFAPYETYLDGLLGLKTSYGAAVLIRNETASKKLALYEKYIPAIQSALPLPRKDLPSKRGHLTPMEVVDSPFRGGDLRHGYQAVADNLPNDPRIHEAKGTKKIFFKNFMDARVNDVILPLAKQVMEPRQAARVTAQGYLAIVVMHEISHGLGPSYARVGGKQVDIRQAIGPTYAGLEEAKADIVGMFGLKWLADHGALPKSKLSECYASYVGGIFRTVRYGTGEAHGRAELMEFNYLSQQKAITWDAEIQRYAIDDVRMPDALATLAKVLLDIEASGNRAGAEAWFKRYDTLPATLQAALQKTQNVPVDIDPVFSFHEQPE